MSRVKGDMKILQIKTQSESKMKSNRSASIIPLGRLKDLSVLGCCAFLLLQLPSVGQSVEVDESLQHVFSHDSEGGPTAVRDLSIGPDGSIYVVGLFNTVDDQPTGNVVRFLPDGSLDPDYPQGSGYSGGVTACALQDDGKLIVGRGERFNDTRIPFLSRLTADGELDTSFNVGEGPFNVDFPIEIYNILIAGSDDIYITGNFNLWDVDEEVSALIRIRGNGSRDSTFTPIFFRASDNPPGSNRAVVDTLSRYSDGRLLVGGYFDTVNGEAKEYIVRLNADGSIDETFQIGSGPEPSFDPSAVILDTLIQPDGKVILTGGIGDFNGTPVKGAVRLNEDGSVDPSFAVEFGHSAIPFVAPAKMAMDSYGRVIINGVFDRVNGVLRQGLVRLLPDGRVDPDFDFAPGMNSGLAWNLRLTNSDEPVVVGSIQLEGFLGNNLYRFTMQSPQEPVILEFTASPQDGAYLRASNPTQDVLILQASANMVDWISVATDTTRADEVEFFETPDTIATAGPARFYRLQTLPTVSFELDNFDAVAPGSAPDLGEPVGEWSFPSLYVTADAAEPDPSRFSVVTTSSFDSSGSGNSLKIDANPSSTAHLPGLLPEAIDESVAENVIVRFDLFIPAGSHGGCFIYVGGDHGVSGFDTATARGPQLAFASNNQVTTYDAGGSQLQGAYTRDAWQTVELDINLRTDRYSVSIGPRGETLIQLGSDLQFRSGAIDHIDRFTVATLNSEQRWLAYIDNVSLVAIP